MSLSYVPDVLPTEVVIFGCGGTGSRLVPLVAQFMKTISYLPTTRMFLFDYDVIEEKNLSRQNFVRQDVGKYKAEVLGNRYANAYNMTMTVGPVDITTEDGQQHQAWSDLVNSTAPMRIVILCVDSIKARQSILETLLRSSVLQESTLIIDTGNEDSYGQVKLMGISGYRVSSTADVAKLEKSLEDIGPAPYSLTIPSLPFDAEYFFNMQPPAVAASCADLDQTMAINCLVANTVLGILQNLIYRKPLHYHRYNIDVMHGTTVENINLAYIKNLSVEEIVKILPASICGRLYTNNYLSELLTLALNQKKVFYKNIAAEEKARKIKAKADAALLAAQEVLPKSEGETLVNTSATLAGITAIVVEEQAQQESVTNVNAADLQELAEANEWEAFENIPF